MKDKEWAQKKDQMKSRNRNNKKMVESRNGKERGWKRENSFFTH